MSSLYKIDAQIAQAIEAGFSVDEETGEVIDGGELLERLSAERDAKLESVALYIKNLGGDVTAMQAEEKSLRERRQTLENKTKRLMDYLSDSLLKNGQTKFETPRCALSFRKSEALEVANEAEFIARQRALGRMDYLTVKDPTINKTAVKTALKSGEEIPGCAIVERQNLQIK